MNESQESQTGATLVRRKDMHLLHCGCFCCCVSKYTIIVCIMACKDISKKKGIIERTFHTKFNWKSRNLCECTKIIVRQNHIIRQSFIITSMDRKRYFRTSKDIHLLKVSIEINSHWLYHSLKKDRKLHKALLLWKSSSVYCTQKNPF